MVHCRNVTAVYDRDCLSKFDCHRGKSSGPGADLVRSDGTNGINDSRFVSQAVNFLPCAVDAEFAIGLYQCCAPKVKGAKAVLNNVGL